MNMYDILPAVIIVFFGWINYKKGIILTILRLVAFVLAALLLGMFGPVIEKLFTEGLGLKQPISTVLTYASVILSLGILAFITDKLIKIITKPIGLNFFNKLLGGIFGLAVGFICVVGIILATSYLPSSAFSKVKNFAKKSLIANYALDTAEKISVEDLKNEVIENYDKAKKALEKSKAVNTIKEKAEDVIEDAIN